VDLVFVFLSSMGVAFSGALMPGPMLAVVVSESPRLGAKTGPLVVAGHALLELALIAAIVVGLGTLLERGSVQGVIVLVGGFGLLAMGAAMALAVARGRVRLDVQAREDGARSRPVLAGAVSSLLNPYWLIWWATIGIAYLTRSYAAGVIGVAAFFAGHILGDVTWYSLVGVVIAAGRRFISLGVYRLVVAGCAAFLLALAAVFVASGLQSL
jgi:threonine/homoserine/homoserine lactone efflux protein